MNWISTLFIFLFGGYIFNFVELSSVVFLDPYHKKIIGKLKFLAYSEITANSHCFCLFVCFQQLIYSRFFSGKSDVTSDTHSSYRANRDFFSVVFTSRVIVAAMKVLGFENKAGAPSNHSLPTNLNSMKKAEKLDCLLEMSAKVVDEFVFQHASNVNDLVNRVVTQQERDEVLNHQQLTPDGRFPCRFPGCERSFKYNGKSRRLMS